MVTGARAGQGRAESPESLSHVAALPFLRWAGGKRWLAPMLVPVVSAASRYFEPFLGGGSVFIASRPVDACLSDANGRLVEAYVTVRDDPISVVERIASWENTAACYYEVRAQSFDSPIDRAAQFIYLNRTCWNGLYRVNRFGQFNVPYGNNLERTVIDVANLLVVSEILQPAEIRADDFTSSVRWASAGDFVYLDPPYLAQGSNGFARYNAERFNWSDQERLAKTVRELVDRGCAVALSNPDDPAAHTLFPYLRRLSFTRQSLIAGTSAHRTRVGEALYCTADIFDVLTEAWEPE